MIPVCKRQSGPRRQASAPIATLDPNRSAARPAVLVWLSGADRLLMAARLRQAQIHVVEVGMVAEPLPQSIESVEAAAFARRALHDELAPAKIAQAFHQLAIATGSSLTCVV